MKILCLDSSNQVQSLAICESSSGEILAADYAKSESTRGRSSSYLPMIIKIMDSAGLSAQGIDCLAVCVGPGSFTGIRTALSIAKTLAAQLGLKIIPVNNFDLIRFENNLGEDQPLAIKAGHMGFFISLDTKYSESETNFFLSLKEKEEQHPDLAVYEFGEENPSLLIAKFIESRYLNSSSSFESASCEEAEIEPYYLREPSIGGK